MAVLVERLLCVMHEDDHVLVVNKPAGVNTHAPSPYAGEGIYDWLRHREPRWADLAIIHRLDKATSGVMVFAKSKVANQSLTQQFTERKVRKRYVLLTTEEPAEKRFTVRSGIVRRGERYARSAQGEPAETMFSYDGEVTSGDRTFHLIEAEPVTGRTHQIRVHAEFSKMPILGDELYSGAEFPRVCLHAEEITFWHPGSAGEVTYCVEPDFFADRHTALRAGVIDSVGTNAFRLIHGAADQMPGLYAEIWAGRMLVQSAGAGAAKKIGLGKANTVSSVYFKKLDKGVGKSTVEEAQPQWVSGEEVPERFTALENGVRYEISFQQGYSVGLFMDQRENRRRLLKNYVAPGFSVFAGSGKGKEVLNTFSYTCGFSVCAALAGARTTSLDLSKKYLEWGKRNFALNDLEATNHDFIYGDVFEWAPRLAKKGRVFDLIILDPPTFSRSKAGGVFQAEKHYGKLVTAVLPLLRAGGVLFASTNAHKLEPEDFLAQLRLAVGNAGRAVQQEHFAPQPLDFPITKEEPAYLKTVWMRVK